MTCRTAKSFFIMTINLLEKYISRIRIEAEIKQCGKQYTQKYNTLTPVNHSKKQGSCTTIQGKCLSSENIGKNNEHTLISDTITSSRLNTLLNHNLPSRNYARKTKYNANSKISMNNNNQIHYSKKNKQTQNISFLELRREYNTINCKLQNAKIEQSKETHWKDCTKGDRFNKNSRHKENNHMYKTSGNISYSRSKPINNLNENPPGYKLQNKKIDHEFNAGDHKVDCNLETGTSNITTSGRSMLSTLPFYCYATRKSQEKDSLDSCDIQFSEKPVSDDFEDKKYSVPVSASHKIKEKTVTEVDSKFSPLNEFMANTCSVARKVKDSNTLRDQFGRHSTLHYFREERYPEIPVTEIQDDKTNSSNFDVHNNKKHIVSKLIGDNVVANNSSLAHHTMLELIKLEKPLKDQLIAYSMNAGKCTEDDKVTLVDDPNQKTDKELETAEEPTKIQERCETEKSENDIQTDSFKEHKYSDLYLNLQKVNSAKKTSEEEKQSSITLLQQKLYGNADKRKHYINITKSANVRGKNTQTRTNYSGSKKIKREYTLYKHNNSLDNMSNIKNKINSKFQNPYFNVKFADEAKHDSKQYLSNKSKTAYKITDHKNLYYL